MPRQICFIGDYGAGKSHTIRQLISPDNPYRQQLNVAHGFDHGTKNELCLDFGDFEIIDIRGLNSGLPGFEDETIISSVNKITGWPCNPSEDRTVFVWVINGQSRRIRKIRETVTALVGNRRLLIYINDRVEIPLDLNWMRYDPSKARQEDIVMLREHFPRAPITNNPWAIVPLIISQNTREDMITDLLTIENQRRARAFQEAVKKRKLVIDKLRAHYQTIYDCRLMFLDKVEENESKKRSRGPGIAFICGIGAAVIGLVALPVIAPLFGAAGLFGAAAYSSGMATLGLGAMATAPLVVGSVAGATGFVVGGAIDKASSSSESGKPLAFFMGSSAKEIVGVNCIFTRAEQVMLDKSAKVLDSYYDLLCKVNPQTENRHFFASLPEVNYPREDPNPPEPASIVETYFDGVLRNAIVAALENGV
jgi:hypothetical protein